MSLKDQDKIMKITIEKQCENNERRESVIVTTQKPPVSCGREKRTSLSVWVVHKRASSASFN
jgi:hypothetical protein